MPSNEELMNGILQRKAEYIKQKRIQALAAFAQGTVMTMLIQKRRQYRRTDENGHDKR